MRRATAGTRGEQGPRWAGRLLAGVLAAVTLGGMATTLGAGSGPVSLVSRGRPPSDTTTVLGDPSLSDDGQFVVFTSLATNLVPGQVRAGRTQGVFLLDRASEAMVLVSHTAASPVANGNGNSRAGVISGDGRIVVFVSRATDLVDGLVAPVPQENVFAYDRVTGSISLVSRTATSASTTGNGRSDAPVVSADGRFVAFVSQATNLVTGFADGNGANDSDVYLHDRATGQTSLVSRTTGSATTSGNDRSDGPVISADGAFVAFVSQATDLVTGFADGNAVNESDVYRFARGSGEMRVVSRTAGSATTSGNDRSDGPVISADGRFVAFVSRATDLVTGGLTDANTGFGTDVFRHDGQGETTVLVSRSTVSATTTGDHASRAPKLSADGGLVAFESSATDLVTGQTGDVTDNVFVRDVGALTTTLVSRVPGSATTGGDRSSSAPAVSADGTVVAFVSRATNLVAGQTGDFDRFDSHVFLHDRLAGTTTLVSRQAGSAVTLANGSSEDLVLSADGRVVAFTSFASDLVAGVHDSDAEPDLFVFEADAGVLDLVSRRDPGLPSATSGESRVDRHALSADGRFVVFTSVATNLVDGQVDANLAPDVFLHDRLSGAVALVSRVAGSEATAGVLQATGPVISADGAFVAFTSSSTDLVAGQVPFNRSNVFLHDRVAGTTGLVSRVPASAVTAGDETSGSPVLSANGRFVAFVSQATNLVDLQQDANGDNDVFLHDQVAGGTVLVSRRDSSDVTAGDGASDSPVISADGRFVAFVSQATNLLDLQQDANGDSDVFLYDRVEGTLRLVSRTATSAVTTGDGRSDSPVISADGRLVAFVSRATNLVDGQSDGNLTLDVFLYDRVSETTTLVSRRVGSTSEAGDGLSLDPVISADGRFVAFASQATDLVGGLVKGNTDSDVFLYDQVAGTMTLVSRTTGSALVSGNLTSGQPLISADGGVVAFQSAATDLVADQVEAGGLRDVYRYDRLAGTIALVSRGLTRLAGRSAAAGPVGGNGLSQPEAMDADGRVIAFGSDASNLTSEEDRNGDRDVFLWVSPCADARPCPGTADRRLR